MWASSKTTCDSGEGEVEDEVPHAQDYLEYEKGPEDPTSSEKKEKHHPPQQSPKIPHRVPSGESFSDDSTLKICKSASFRSIPTRHPQNNHSHQQEKIASNFKDLNETPNTHKKESTNSIANFTEAPLPENGFITNSNLDHCPQSGEKSVSNVEKCLRKESINFIDLSGPSSFKIEDFFGIEASDTHLRPQTSESMELERKEKYHCSVKSALFLLWFSWFRSDEEGEARTYQISYVWDHLGPKSSGRFNVRAEIAFKSTRLIFYLLSKKQIWCRHFINFLILTCEGPFSIRIWNTNSDQNISIILTLEVFSLSSNCAYKDFHQFHDRHFHLRRQKFTKYAIELEEQVLNDFCSKIIRMDLCLQAWTSNFLHLEICCRLTHSWYYFAGTMNLPGRKGRKNNKSNPLN